jgi:hypothetical protein
MMNELIEKYNFDEFTPAKVGPWMRFAESPKLGEPAADFPLWELDGQNTRLRTIWEVNLFTVVEFGSFT